MKDILLCGCQGKMGHVVRACVAQREDCRIVAGVDVNADAPADFPVYQNAKDCQEKVDVIIDYSHPNSLDGLLEYAFDKNVPIDAGHYRHTTPTRSRKLRKAAEKNPDFLFL